MAISTKRGVHNKYTVAGGHLFAKTDTLDEAKRAGTTIAKKEAWRGKWNRRYIILSISKQGAPGSVFYRDTGWNMYVPVRGSGEKAEHILAEIQRRHGVKPFVWTRR